jgi:hypothetical protein
LLDTLGPEVIELRVGRDPDKALIALRNSGVAGDDAFAIGSTLTVPLQGRSGVEAITSINSLGLTASAITTRQPNLDDVYLRLTGSSLAA